MLSKVSIPRILRIGWSVTSYLACGGESMQRKRMFVAREIFRFWNPQIFRVDSLLKRDDATCAIGSIW